MSEKADHCRERWWEKILQEEIKGLFFFSFPRPHLLQRTATPQGRVGERAPQVFIMGTIAAAIDFLSSFLLCGLDIFHLS